MSVSFPITIRTPSSLLFDDEGTMLTLFGYGGEFSILAQHEPLVAWVKEGTVILHRDGNVDTFLVKSGFVSMDGARCVLLIVA